MFETQEIETYLADAWPDVDGEKRLVKLRCYINPCSYELAAEADEEIARTLFHLVGSERLPRPTLAKASFNLGQLPPYAFEFVRDVEYGHGVHIPAVSISKIEAAHVTPDSNDWALMFTVSFEKHDPKILNDLADLLHEKFYITFKELQPGLFDKSEDPVMDLLCRLCDAPNPEYATTDGKFAYCVKHEMNRQEGETLRKIRDLLKALDITESIIEPEEEEHRDPLADEAEFINGRNKGKRKKKAIVN